MSNEEAWKKQAAERIKALSPQAAGTTKAARFRTVFPEIEEAMRRGVNQTDLVAALAETGLVMTLDELRNALYRERKRLKRPATKEASHETKNPAPRPAPPPAAAPSSSGQFDWQKHRDQKPEW